MNWLLIIAVVLVIAGIGYLADRSAKKHRLGVHAPRRRHANTGDFKVVKHDLPHELSYNTAEIPMPRTAVQPQVQAGFDYIERRYGPLPALAGRTDTVMAMAIDPKDYPEWAQ